MRSSRLEPMQELAMGWMESRTLRRRARDASRRREHLMAPKVPLHRTERSLRVSLRRLCRRLLRAVVADGARSGPTKPSHGTPRKVHERTA
jgi:hypothetical protein